MQSYIAFAFVFFACNPSRFQLDTDPVGMDNRSLNITERHPTAITGNLRPVCNTEPKSKFLMDC